MAITDVNASSFEAFEGIRILLPGAIAVSLYGGVAATYGSGIVSPTSNALGAVVAALLIGLFLLFIDLPVKSATYQSPDLPDRELRDWDIDPKPYGDYINLYFVMLDVSFPANIRNRALYMGAMFRIGFEATCMSGITALGVIVTAAAFPLAGADRGGTTSTRTILFAVAGFHAVTIIGAFLGRYRFRRRRHPLRRDALNLAATELREDLGVLALLTILGAACALGIFIVTKTPVASIVAVALPAIAWIWLFFRGRSQADNARQPRRPLGPPAAVLLYGVAAAIALVEAGLRINKQSTFDTRTALAWSVLSLIPALLIATRGYERKLIGSFRTQTTWMRINKAELIKDHHLNPSTTAASPVASS